MNTTNLKFLILLSGLFIADQARASLFELTFTDNGVNTGSGQILATDDGGGVYTATWGDFTLKTGGAFTWLAYSLVPGNAPVAQGIINSGGLNLNGDNVVFYPAAQYLDSSGGLLFETSLGAGGPVLNLWGNGPGNYSLYGAGDASGLGSGGGYQVNGNVTINLAAVPEPSTLISGALLWLPLGASTLRILRKARAT